MPDKGYTGVVMARGGRAELSHQVIYKLYYLHEYMNIYMKRKTTSFSKKVMEKG